MNFQKVAFPLRILLLSIGFCFSQLVVGELVAGTPRDFEISRGHEIDVKAGVRAMLMLEPRPVRASRQSVATVTFSDAKTGFPISIRSAFLRYELANVVDKTKTYQLVKLQNHRFPQFKTSFQFNDPGEYQVTVTATEKRSTGLTVHQFDFDVVVGSLASQEQKNYEKKQQKSKP